MTFKKKNIRFYKTFCQSMFRPFFCKIHRNGSGYILLSIKFFNFPTISQKLTAIVFCYYSVKLYPIRVLAICNPACVNGNCTAPDTCTCNPGFGGSACDIGELVESL